MCLVLLYALCWGLIFSGHTDWLGEGEEELVAAAPVVRGLFSQAREALMAA